MGGYGSGRRRRKTSVEDCLFLDINKLRRAGFSPAPVFAKSANVFRKKKVVSIASKLVDDRDDNPLLGIGYIIEHEGKKEKIFQMILLQSTLLCSGGERWWFTCPLTIGDVPCDRRVGKLWLPPGAIYFGCRHCYGLTYRSCQESHTRDRLLERVLERSPGLPRRLVKREMDLMWETFRPIPTIWGV